MSQVFKNLKKIFLDNFLLLVVLEKLSQYPDIDISHWRKEEFQWIMNKVFREKVFDLNDFDTFLTHFSTEFLVFACNCCCFHNDKAFCDVLLITYAWQKLLSDNGGIGFNWACSLTSVESYWI